MAAKSVKDLANLVRLKSEELEQKAVEVSVAQAAYKVARNSYLEAVDALEMAKKES